MSACPDALPSASVRTDADRRRKDARARDETLLPTSCIYAYIPEMSAETTSAAAALAGALIGAGAILVNQWRSAKLERQRMKHETRGRVNALSASVFREYLAACKVVERLAERREGGDVPSDAEITTATDVMWLKLQEVEVFCPSAVVGKAREFVEALLHSAWHRADPSVVEHLATPRLTSSTSRTLCSARLTRLLTDVATCGNDSSIATDA